jgi:hypothetical protein
LKAYNRIKHAKREHLITLIEAYNGTPTEEFIFEIQVFIMMAQLFTSYWACQALSKGTKEDFDYLVKTIK